MNLQEFKLSLEKERRSNTEMLRSKDSKSERRISVLHARIEILSWVLTQLEKVGKP